MPRYDKKPGPVGGTNVPDLANAPAFFVKHGFSMYVFPKKTEHSTENMDANGEKKHNLLDK